MSEQKRIKGSSVAAFLFMPQFHLSFQHMAHLAPVFMRSIALIFSQVGLIPSNHPALMYGIQGVKKIGFAELMGEAWFKLRTTRSTPDQWGLFLSVIFMVSFSLAAVVMFMLHVVFGLGSVAHAQIFDHPLGATNVPLPQMTSFYDRTIPAAGTAQGDYGIMFLDKVLRAGADATGGPLQNATQGLMQIYNSGILIVAGVMLFWSILSVVVDTAKTGIVGGGRHNMVWAPIRIVFALGLLIPLGATGFSSGQFLVMKLAEWGSNFGTRAWVTYVGGILNDATMVAGLKGQNPTSLVNEYAHMWLCRIAYNGYAAQTNTLTANEEVMAVTQPGPTMGTQTVAYTNTHSNQLCGTISFSDGQNPLNLVSVAVGAPGATDLQNARTTITTAYRNAITNITPAAKNLACEFVAEFITSMPAANIMTTATLPSDGTAICSSVGTQGDGNFGAQSQIDAMVGTFTGTVTPALTAARATVQSYMTSAAFMADIRDRGWAGMGIWYHRISQLNKVAYDFQFPTVTITAGDWATQSINAGHLNKLKEIMTKYDEWWLTGAVTLANVPTAPGPTGVPQTVQNNKAKAPSVGSIASSFASNVKDASPTGLWGMFMKMFGSNSDTTVFLFDLVEKDDPNIYPLAELANTGGQIMTYAMGIIGTLTLVPLVLAATGLIPLVDSEGLAAALQASPIYSALATIGFGLLASGALLSYYVPIIPFLRTALSVLTWITSVFEAVVMVPIAALSFLTTEGEGMGAKQVWPLWLNVLVRPVLTVAGFVGALLIFNAFVVYFNEAFSKALIVGNAGGDTYFSMIDTLLYTIAYVMTIYTVANTSFKLLDLIPNAMVRWLGGSPDTSFDQSDMAEYISAGTHLLKGAGGTMGRGVGRLADKVGGMKPGSVGKS